MGTGRPVRIDWEALKSRMAAAGKDPAAVCLFCLPEAGRQLLIAISERLEWRATYRIEDYDYSDWDTLQDYVEQTVGELTMNDCGASLVQQITQNVQQIVTQQNYYSEVCCYLDQQPVQDPDPSGAPMPPDIEELGELCKQAQMAHDLGQDFLSQTFGLASAGVGLTAGLIATLLAGLALSLPFVLIGVLLTAIVALVADEFADEAEIIWAAIKHDVVCAIVTASSATAAKAAVDDIIEAEVEPQSSITATLFRTMYSQAAINNIWDKTYDAGAYSATYCEDCQQWDTIGGYAYKTTNYTEPAAGRIKVGSWGDALPLNATWHAPSAIPETICEVLEGLEAHLYGEIQTTNFNPDFNPLTDSKLSMGIQTTAGAIGDYSVLYEEFRLLVSDSTNPNNWYWVNAYVDTTDQQIPGEFEVTTGVGGSVSMSVDNLPGASTYAKDITLAIP